MHNGARCSVYIPRRQDGSDTSPITALLIGLMGVLLIAKKKGLIDSMHDLIERLESEAGFYLSRQVKEKVIAVAGE